MRYLIIVEETETGFSAYSPDVTGCVATGETEYQVEQLMREAIVFHLEGLAEAGLPIPKPRSYTTYSTVPDLALVS
jgi:predicted RNase H-like HicB family nuclease